MLTSRHRVLDLSRWGIGRCAVLFPLLLLLACNRGYGAPVDRATFASAVLHEDGARCVFALHDAVYRPAKGFAPSRTVASPATVSTATNSESSTCARGM